MEHLKCDVSSRNDTKKSLSDLMISEQNNTFNWSYPEYDPIVNVNRRKIAIG